MIYLVTYDIAANSVRYRISRALEGYGNRVQESVFECRIEEGAARELAAKLAPKIVGADGIADIRFYRACANCRSASFGIGETVRTQDPGTCIIY